MTIPTPEKLAELRTRAECRKVDGAQWVEVGPVAVLSLLDALEAQRVELERLRGALRRNVSSTLAEVDAYLASPLGTDNPR